MPLDHKEQNKFSHHFALFRKLFHQHQPLYKSSLTTNDDSHCISNFCPSKIKTISTSRWENLFHFPFSSLAIFWGLSESEPILNGYRKLLRFFVWFRRPRHLWEVRKYWFCIFIKSLIFLSHFFDFQSSLELYQ